MAIRKARQGKKNGTSNPVWTYFFDTEKCKVCSRSNGCYKENAKSKTYSVSIRTDEQETQLAFQQTFKTKARERYKIEAKIAELKHVYGFDRAESYGLYSMQMQGAITIFAANIKRILKLI